MRQFLKATGSESGLVADFENGPTVRFGNGSEPGTGRALGGHQPDVRLDIVDDAPGAARKPCSEPVLRSDQTAR